MRSLVQSPFTNPVEKHNGIAKSYLKEIKYAHPDAPLELICQESQIVKKRDYAKMWILGKNT